MVMGVKKCVVTDTSEFYEEATTLGSESSEVSRMLHVSDAGVRQKAEKLTVRNGSVKLLVFRGMQLKFGPRLLEAFSKRGWRSVAYVRRFNDDETLLT